MTFTEEIWTYAKSEDQLLNKAKELLTEGKLINSPEYNNIYTPINAAVRSGFLDLLKFLVDNLDVIDDKAIGDAIRFGLLEEFKILMTPIQDKNILLKDAMDVSPLFLASQSGQVEIFEWLIENGASIKTDDVSNNDIPIIHCAGNLAIAKRLVELGVDVNEKDDCGISPLSNHAADDNKEDILKFLIENGAELDSQDDWKQTALFRSVSNNKLSNAKILLNFGADKTISDMDGTKPIDRAKSLGNNELVDLLK